MNTPATSRIVYLDNFRAFAMLLGIFVHVTTLGDFGSLKLFADVSFFFRMAAFFAISGFFAFLLLEKWPVAQFLKARLVVILVPLATALLFLNPLTLWLIFKYHNPDLTAPSPQHLFLLTLGGSTDGLSGPLIWHLHLWFLFSLASFVLIAPLFHDLVKLDRVADVLDKAFRLCTPVIVPLVIAVLVGISVVVLRSVERFLVNPLFESWLIQATLRYLPYFLLGMVLYARPREWELVHRLDIPSIAVGLLAKYAASVVTVKDVSTTLTIFGNGILRCATIFFLLWAFRRFLNWHNHFLRLLSSSIYTVYLFHYILIYMIAVYVPVFDRGTPLQYFFVSAVVFVAALGLHVGIVQQLRPVGFLFNGKPTGRIT